MANRYWVGGTANWDATAGTKWALTSGGVGGQAVPTSADDVFFDAASGASVVSFAGVVCKSLTCTGFTGTLNGSGTISLDLNGNVTLSNTMTLNGTYRIQTGVTSTITSNGKPFQNLTINGTAIVTLADNCTVNTAFRVGNATINGSTLFVSGSWDSISGGNLTGTTSIEYNGTTTIGNTSPLTVRNNININAGAGTVTFTSGSTFNYNTGTLTYTSGTVVTTNHTLNIVLATTLATNGMSWGAVNFSGSAQTYTLTNNLTANGTVTFSGTTSQTINGSTLICKGNLTSISASVFVTGTTNISMQGTSTIVGSNGGYALNIDINTAGTITFTNTLYWKSGTFSLTSGAINAGTSTINHFSAGAFVLSLGSAILYNVTFASTSSIGTALNCSGTLTLNTTTLNTYAINCSGTLIVGGTCSGSSLITLNGTGTWSGSGTLQNSLTINTLGTVTISGTINYSTGTITYVSGTVNAAGSTLTIIGSSTLSTNGISWNNITINTGTITINSLLSASGTLSLGSSGTVTFSGTSGFSVSNLSCVTAGRSIILANGNTYNILSSLVLTGATASRITIQSSTTSSSFFKLAYTASQSVSNTNATWIDSSGGQTINTSAGTLSNTVNWGISTGNFLLMF